MFIKIFSLETTGPIATKLGWPPSKVVSSDPDFQPRWPPSYPMTISSTFSSYWANGLTRRFLWEFPIVSYVKLNLAVAAMLCVRWSRLPTKMATKLKIEKRGNEIFFKSSPLKLLSQSEKNHPMTISSKFSSYWANGFRQQDFYGNFP
jgi:hypothetical protein